MYALAFLLVPQLVSAAAILGERNISENRAVYFLDNNPAGSSIVSLRVSVADGTLSDPVVTCTDGVGLWGVNAPTTPGGPPVAATQDTMFCQDSVVVSQDYLFTVNSGSNSVAMFSINKDDPYHPTMVASPANSMGEFPASVAYSPLLKTACVLNGGAVGGVACYSVDHAKGLTPLGGLRAISLNQTTPPLGPPGTVSDIVFNPSQTALIATVKGNGTAPGFIYTWPVLNGAISQTPVISRPVSMLVDFSISFLGSDSRVLMSDPAYGAAILNVSPSFKFNVATHIAIPGQTAVCWSVYSLRFNTVFAMDAGNANITMVNPATGALTGSIFGSASDGGSFDSKMDREYLYVLRKSPSISVINSLGANSGKVPKQVQDFDISSVGSRQGFTGMATYPSS